MPELTAEAKDVLIAFKNLHHPQRTALLKEMAVDKILSQDILDLAIITIRREETSRPFRGFK